MGKGKPFVPGDPRAGRRHGSKNRLINGFYAAIEKVCNEPCPINEKLTRLEGMFRIYCDEDPPGACRFVGSLMPKEWFIENVVSELSEDELEMMILRERERIAREEAPLMIEAKANGDGAATPAERS